MAWSTYPRNMSHPDQAEPQIFHPPFLHRAAIVVHAVFSLPCRRGTTPFTAVDLLYVAMDMALRAMTAMEEWLGYFFHTSQGLWSRITRSANS